MRRLALTAALLMLAACQTRQPIVVPKIVRVTVPQIVAVPAELTRDCDDVNKRENSVGEAIRLANARAESLKECTGRMRKIRELKR